MLNKLIYYSRTTEINATTARIISAYQQANLSEDAYLSGVFTALEQQNTQLSDAINRSNYESVLAEKDDVRDKLVKGIHYLLMGFVLHPDTVIQEAAMKVKAVFDRYGVGIASETYASESSLINALLRDFQEGSIQTALTQIPGCVAMCESLQTAQTDFEQTRLEYEKQSSIEAQLKSASDIKKEVVKIINDQLLVYLTAMNQVQPQVYGDIYLTIDKIIETNNNTVKNRRKAKKEVVSEE